MRVEGHTDNRGKADYNRDLSAPRAVGHEATWLKRASNETACKPQALVPISRLPTTRPPRVAKRTAALTL